MWNVKQIKLLILFLLLFNPLFAISPDNALHLLKEGNNRFVQGKVLHPRLMEEVRKLQISTQNPFCAILGCSDSRVPPELIFDQGIGELFVVRLAGNVASRSAIESLDFASNVLNVALILVIGHQNCGAVNAVVTHQGEGDLGAIASLIAPAVDKAPDLRAAIIANVRSQMERVKEEPALLNRLNNGSLKVVGAYYNFETREVEFIEDKLL